MADIIDALSFERNGHRGPADTSTTVTSECTSSARSMSVSWNTRSSATVASSSFVPMSSPARCLAATTRPDDLVDLILEETVGPLVTARTRAFSAEAEHLSDDESDREGAVSALAEHDPAEAILSLRICDPAMGSGHFLVALVDWLADRALAAMAEAEAQVPGYVSPLAARIRNIRERIAANAQQQDWLINPERSTTAISCAAWC